MLGSLKSFLWLVGVWAFLIGWSVVFAFDDRGAASNVSAIVMSPVLLLPVPGLVFVFALCFWCIVSLLAVGRENTFCRYLAFGLLTVHWFGAIYMLGRDLLTDGGVAKIARAFWSHPSLGLFLLTYGLLQYYICRQLAGETPEAT